MASRELMASLLRSSTRRSPISPPLTRFASSASSLPKDDIPDDFTVDGLVQIPPIIGAIGLYHAKSTLEAYLARSAKRDLSLLPTKSLLIADILLKEGIEGFKSCKVKTAVGSD